MDHCVPAETLSESARPAGRETGGAARDRLPVSRRARCHAAPAVRRARDASALSGAARSAQSAVHGRCPGESERAPVAGHRCILPAPAAPAATGFSAERARGPRSARACRVRRRWQAAADARYVVNLLSTTEPWICRPIHGVGRGRRSALHQRIAQRRSALAPAAAGLLSGRGQRRRPHARCHARAFRRPGSPASALAEANGARSSVGSREPLQPQPPAGVAAARRTARAALLAQARQAFLAQDWPRTIRSTTRVLSEPPGPTVAWRANCSASPASATASSRTPSPSTAAICRITRRGPPPQACSNGSRRC